MIAVIGTFIMTMLLFTRPSVCSSFWQKQHDGYLSSSLFTRPCAVRLFSVPSYRRPDEWETFADVSEVKKKTLQVLNNISTEEFQKCFQQWEKHRNVGTSVSSQKESTLKETRFVIVQNPINHLKK